MVIKEIPQWGTLLFIIISNNELIFKKGDFNVLDMDLRHEILEPHGRNHNMAASKTEMWVWG